MIYPFLRQIAVMSDEIYELIFDDNGTDIRIIGGIDVGTISVVPWEPDLFWTGKLGDPRPVAAAVMAFYRARQGDLTTWQRQNPGQSNSGQEVSSMTVPHLKQITFVSNDVYEVAFDDAIDPRSVYKIEAGRTAPVVVDESNLLEGERVGDPRPIVAAVMAFHHARYQDLTTYRSPKNTGLS